MELVVKSATKLARIAALAILASVVACGRHESSASRGDEAPRHEGQFANVDDARLAAADSEPQNWLIYNGSWHEQRFSALTQIDANNVARLKPAWFIEFDTTRGQEATPLVVDGVMYVSTAWSKVHALDAKTGKQLWYYDPKAPGISGVPACCDVDNRGVALYKGRVYLGTVDGRLVALDAGSGKEVWSTQTTPRDSTYLITGAPRVAHGKVFIGNAGADFGTRGYVSAYDAADGKLLWRFYTVPNRPGSAPDGAASDEVLKNKAAQTWPGEWYTAGGGGHVWNSLVYDPDFNQVYLATGNGFPWNPNLRTSKPGDNLFIASIVAVDADTGAYKWHYQESPGEGWDHDSVSDMVLADLAIGGQSPKVLVHPPKNGFMYVIDRQSGKLLSADPYVHGINWATGVDLQTGRPQFTTMARYKDKPVTVSPGGGGAHNWNPIAFSPRTGLLYLQVSDNSSSYLEPVSRKDYAFAAEKPSLGISFPGLMTGGAHGAAPAMADPSGKKTSPAPARDAPKGYLMAWDPVARKSAWQVEGSGGGVLATAGGLVFQGKSRNGVLGEFAAYRADTGERLWHIDTPNAIIAGAMSYSVDGEQYIAVASGANSMSGGGPTYMSQPGRLLVFKLDGAATLPGDPPLAGPAQPPQQLASQADVAEGLHHYDAYCIRCHGPNAMGNNVIPDLRRSVLLTQPQAWHGVVGDGTLEARGMMGWSKYLSAEQIEKIRLYVGEQARRLQQPQ